MITTVTLDSLRSELLDLNSRVTKLENHCFWGSVSDETLVTFKENLSILRKRKIRELAEQIEDLWEELGQLQEADWEYNLGQTKEGETHE